ncbi:Major Facilitator Superfamily protein [Planctomycetes bacterium Pla163]|uniref:Major Facilitator Superfamily protein n=1 Tax=Rohdeia mirabilis TaxID=2528008 RepID=A0A518CW30_9BACT|nr:Major Facilitator Superfamily protein [Planctomycetes bacterium Pla163]
MSTTPSAPVHGNAHGSRDYALVTAAYWVFTLSDGALRTLVLLHLSDLGYAPLAIAGMFAAYEALGVLTNLAGGWLGARHGLKLPLGLGMALQAATLLALGGAASTLPLALLVAGQGACGMAKDLVKTSAKSYVKLVVPEHEGSRLMRLVSLLTGSKNALKGVGFLLGGVLLGSIGFANTCYALGSALVVAGAVALAFLPPRPGQRAGSRVRELLSKDARLNWLAAARLFLFAARDVWFVLAVPVFLRVELGWSLAEVSGFLAAWTIGYGIVQAFAPRWIGREPDARRLIAAGLALVVPLVLVALFLDRGVAPGPVLVVGLSLFGLVFAANSALHSFLVVRYATRERVALDVGFYYASNALGRLVGTVASGWIYQSAGAGDGGPTAGVVRCVLAAALLAALAFAFGLPLRRAERARLT